MNDIENFEIFSIKIKVNLVKVQKISKELSTNLFLRKLDLSVLDKQNVLKLAEK